MRRVGNQGCNPGQVLSVAGPIPQAPRFPTAPRRAPYFSPSTTGQPLCMAAYTVCATGSAVPSSYDPVPAPLPGR